LDAQHHLVGAQCQAIIVDRESLATSCDVQGLAVPWTGEALTVHHGHPDARLGVQGHPNPRCHVGVDEVVGGSRIHQGGETGAVNDDVVLHGAACPWLNPSEGMKGNCRFRRGVRVGWRGLLRHKDDFNDTKMLADVAMTQCVELVTLEALALAPAFGDLHWRQPFGGYLVSAGSYRGD
jgi:hypothetical protein